MDYIQISFSALLRFLFILCGQMMAQDIYVELSMYRCLVGYAHSFIYSFNKNLSRSNSCQTLCLVLRLCRPLANPVHIHGILCISVCEVNQSFSKHSFNPCLESPSYWELRDSRNKPHGYTILGGA